MADKIVGGYKVGPLIAMGEGCGKGIIASKARVVPGNPTFEESLPYFNNIEPGEIIVAHNIGPQHMCFIKYVGGIISGSFIRRIVQESSFGVPMVHGIDKDLTSADSIVDLIKDGDTIIIEGPTGMIFQALPIADKIVGGYKVGPLIAIGTGYGKGTIAAKVKLVPENPTLVESIKYFKEIQPGQIVVARRIDREHVPWLKKVSGIVAGQQCSYVTNLANIGGESGTGFPMVTAIDKDLTSADSIVDLIEDGDTIIIEGPTGKIFQALPIGEPEPVVDIYAGLPPDVVAEMKKMGL